jgi:hypothetical protein
MAHDNAEMLGRFYSAYEGRDWPTMEPLLTEDAFVLVTGSGSLGGTHRGRDRVAAFLEAVWDQAPDGFELDIHDVLANDHHGLVIVEVSARRGDAEYREWETHVHELSDGQSAGFFIYWNDTTPAESFF